MKTALKVLLPLTLFAASSAYAANSCGGHGQDDYYFDNAPSKKASVKITLKGAGSADISKIIPPDPANPSFLGQYYNLKDDCSFTSAIYGQDVNSGQRTELFIITGTWSYPAESKTIYLALDGDVSQGAALDPAATTWGRLMNGGLSIPVFMPLIFSTKISAVELIPQSLITKTATITPGKNGTAKTSLAVTGKVISTDVKSTRKEANFAFTSILSAIETTPPAP